MLQSINEIVDYYSKIKTLSESFPGAVIKNKSTSELDLESFDEFGLSEEYLSFISKYCIMNVEIGYLSLYPTRAEKLNESLRLANNDNKNPYVGENYIHIASYEVDLILGKKQTSFHSDCEIYYQDIGTGFFPDRIKIAETFEYLIIGMANLDKILLDNVKDPLGALQSILHTIDPKIKDDALSVWCKLCEEAM